MSDQSSDAVFETDLDAYIDNQLDAAGRARVEAHLAARPEAAARVMADLSIRSTLKLALSVAPQAIPGAMPTARPQTREAARRLTAHLHARRHWGMLQRIAAVGLLVSAGLFANSSIGPFGPREVNASVRPPQLIEQAVRAHQTALVRETMPSQPEIGTYDRDGIRAATAIVMPKLPDGWKVTDVQIFPSDFGPSVEARVVAGDGLRLSLFAVRPGHFAVEPVKDIAMADAKAAWWQIGDVAYAVVSDQAATTLSNEAERLKTSLY